MTIEQAKEELVKRYKYLYENAFFILDPFVNTNSKGKQKELTKYMNMGPFTSKEINSIFEEFLLSDKNIEDTTLYKMVESKRNDEEYVEQVKKDYVELQKDNPYFHSQFSIFKILDMTAKYVESQCDNSKFMKNKLRVIDEYFRIARYKNDGRIYTSGIRPNLHDYASLIMPVIPIQKKIINDKTSSNIKRNPFITAIVNAPYYEYNWSIFTEEEKQKVYLDFHDELPCDLEIVCSDCEEKISKEDENLYRPSGTSCCGEVFTIKEDEIFVNPNDSVNKFYQICPHCGYIVNIPSEILSDGIKKRIEERCNKDKMLFRKMFLYSELLSLDKKSTEGQKRLIKK